jgi:hypothetical protein
MNEFLIKLRALFTGSGFTEAELGLKKVKEAAEDAEKATDKAGRATTLAAAPTPGKAFSQDEARTMARSWMQEEIAKAEAAQKALGEVEEQAVKTKQVLRGEGGSEGGGFLNGIIRGGAAVLAGIGVGKFLAAQIDKITVAYKNLIPIQQSFVEASRDMANATSFDHIVSGLEQTSAAIAEARKNLEALREDWGSWTADLLMGGKNSRAMEDQIRGMEVTKLADAVKGSQILVDTQSQLADVAGDAGATERIKRAAQRRREMFELNKSLGDPTSATPLRDKETILANKAAAYAEEDRALERLNAKKLEAWEIDQALRKATADGNVELAYRLNYTKAYNAAIDKALALGVTDPEELKRRAKADADLIKRPDGIGPETSYADKVMAAENKSRREALELELQIAEAKAAGNDEEVKRLNWMKEYKGALEQAKAAGMGDEAWNYATRAANAGEKAGDKVAKPSLGVSDAARLGMAVGESRHAAATLERMNRMVEATTKSAAAAERAAVAAEALLDKKPTYGS